MTIPDDLRLYFLKHILRKKKILEEKSTQVRKLTFSSPVATAEFSKFAGILNAALSQHHLLSLGDIS